MAQAPRPATVKKPRGITGEAFLVPLGLVGELVASRRGEHWKFSEAETRALADALAGVVTELLPLVPVLDDSPLAAACTALATTAATVIGTRLYLDYLVMQARRREAAEAATEHQAAGVVPFPGAVL